MNTNIIKYLLLYVSFLFLFYFPRSTPYFSFFFVIAGIYLSIVLFLGVFSTVATVFVLYFHHHDNNKPVRRWIVKFYLRFFVPITSWRRIGEKDDDTSDHINDGIDTMYLAPKDRKRIYPATGIDTGISQINSRSTSVLGNGKNINDPDGQNMTSPRMRASPNSAKQTLFANDKSSPEAEQTLTWQEISQITDAALFRILTIFILVLTTGVLMALIIGGYTT